MKLIVDNSRLENVATCDLKTVLRDIHGYTGEETEWALAGQAAHVSLADYFRSGGDAQIAMSGFEQSYREWATNNVPSDDRLSWQNTHDIMQEYYRTHPLERFPFIPIPETEEKGVIVPLTDEIDYYSLLDLAGHEKTIGATYVVDHKTTGKVTHWWQKKFRIGSQLSGYIWTLGIIRGEVVAGAYVNVIEFSKLPDIRYKNDGGEYKCRTHKTVYSECRHMHANWELLICTRSPEQIDKWKSDAITHAQRFKMLEQTFGNRPDLIPFAAQQGTFNNGCTFCEFRDFCAAERRPELINSMLVHRPWAPWDGLRG